MITACFTSFYSTIIVYLVFRNALFLTSLRYGEGDVRMTIFISLMIDLFFVLLFPLLIFAFAGACS